MSDLLNTLSGDIPGLLRRGSPVRWADSNYPRTARSGVYVQQRVVDGVHEVAGDMGRGCAQIEALDDLPTFDLTDPTGRAHAAWWVRSIIRWPETDQDAELLTCAEKGASMTPTQIDTLARLVLRLAGRTP